MVCDGAVVPAALGVNPFATITALAERMVELAAEDTGIRIDLETRNGVLDLFGEPAHNFLPEDAESQQIRADMLLAGNNGDAGLSFTEAMEGFIHIGEGVDDLAVATSIARERSETARFFLSVRSWNTRHRKSRTPTPSIIPAEPESRSGLGSRPPGHPDGHLHMSGAGRDLCGAGRHVPALQRRPTQAGRP